MTTLYHYTNAAGLHGILSSKTIWATDYRFLNDTSEFHFGLKIVNEAIALYDGDLKYIHVEVPLLIEALNDKLERSGICAFVASLSTEGDLLSQWRGYNGGKGYAVGFNSDWLAQNAEMQDFSLFPVTYDEEPQRAAADAAVRLLIRFLEDLEGDPTRLSEIVRKWWAHALKVALAFKDPHFREESEYRLACVVGSWPGKTQIRTSPAGLVPYLPCKYNEKIVRITTNHPNNLGIERIIVGPALRVQQIAAVDALLASHHMRFEVRKSAIPFVAD